MSKPDITFLDTEFMKDVARVFADGQNRPGRFRNQWQDIPFDVVLGRVASAYRHLMDIKDGEYFDTDSGLQNAAHLAANAMILHWHILNHLDGLEK